MTELGHVTRRHQTGEKQWEPLMRPSAVEAVAASRTRGRGECTEQKRWVHSAVRVVNDQWSCRMAVSLC